MNPWDWLNDNSGAMQVVFVGVLAVVTAAYATFTLVMSRATSRQAEASAEMAREMRDQRLEGARPVLALNYNLYDGKVGDAPGVEVRLRNIGPGVALRVEYGFSHPRFAYAAMWLPFLGPQESTDLYRMTRQASNDRNDVEVSVGTMAAVVATYEDIYGRLFETQIALEQNLLGWTERGTRFAMVAGRAPDDRSPPSPNVWHTFRITESGSLQEVNDDP